MRKPFKIEVEIEELETIMTALKLEHLRMVAENDTNEQWLDAIAAAIKAVADFTTNERR